MNMLFVLLEEGGKPLISILLEAFAVKVAEKFGENVGDFIGIKLVEKMDSTPQKSDIIIERC